MCNKVIEFKDSHNENPLTGGRVCEEYNKKVLDAQKNTQELIEKIKYPLTFYLATKTL